MDNFIFLKNWIIKGSVARAASNFGRIVHRVCSEKQKWWILSILCKSNDWHSTVTTVLLHMSDTDPRTLIFNVPLIQQLTATVYVAFDIRFWSHATTHQTIDIYNTYLLKKTNIKIHYKLNKIKINMNSKKL